MIIMAHAIHPVKIKRTKNGDRLLFLEVIKKLACPLFDIESGSYPVRSQRMEVAF
jgi:hypothetical protein